MLRLWRQGRQLGLGRFLLFLFGCRCILGLGSLQVYLLMMTRGVPATPAQVTGRGVTVQGDSPAHELELPARALLASAPWVPQQVPAVVAEELRDGQCKRRHPLAPQLAVPQRGHHCDEEVSATGHVLDHRVHVLADVHALDRCVGLWRRARVLRALLRRQVNGQLYRETFDPRQRYGPARQHRHLQGLLEGPADRHMQVAGAEPCACSSVGHSDLLWHRPRECSDSRTRLRRHGVTRG
mmetsp:Transcript_113021/g.364951  ORF Transcript_113021/g.364951 Transcript_113021/m.364951 type:complete len:239 (+) Transcript_113021:1607-2323(+)